MGSCAFGSPLSDCLLLDSLPLPRIWASSPRRGASGVFFSRDAHTTLCWATRQLPRLECIDEVLRVDVVGEVSDLEEKLVRDL